MLTEKGLSEEKAKAIIIESQEINSKKLLNSASLQLRMSLALENQELTESIIKKAEQNGVIQNGNIKRKAELVSIIKAEMATKGYTEAEIQAKIASMGLGKATGGLKSQLKGLITSLSTGQVAIMAITAAITIASAVYSKYKQRQEEINQNYEETISKVKELKNTINSYKKTISDFEDDYVELSEGIGKNGENLTLTNNQYKRYLEIANQIGDMFPNLIKGYDESGNVVLKYAGSIEKLNEALEKYEETERKKRFV